MFNMNPLKRRPESVGGQTFDERQGHLLTGGDGSSISLVTIFAGEYAVAVQEYDE
jgi:hypothetical protein